MFDFKHVFVFKVKLLLAVMAPKKFVIKVSSDIYADKVDLTRAVSVAPCLL